MSSTRRSILGPLNNGHKTENGKPLRASSRRASIAISTTRSKPQIVSTSSSFLKTGKKEVEFSVPNLLLTANNRSKMKESEKAKSNNIHKLQRNAVKKACMTNKENDAKGEFVSGEDFDFSKPIGSPYLNSPSLSGPMTRSRRLRRTSVYSRPTTHSRPFISSSNGKESKVANNHTPSANTRLKINTFENKYPEEFRAVNIGKPDANVKKYNLSITETETSSNTTDGLEMKNKLPNKQCKPISDIVTPHLRRHIPILRVITNPVSRLSNVQNVAPCTPQPPSDPTLVLKKKLKIKMEAQIKDKVALMPPTSPYSLITDSTTNGSPVESFVKIEERPSRSKAGTFLTETPCPLVNKTSDPHEKRTSNDETNFTSNKKRKDEHMTTHGNCSEDSNLTTPKSKNSKAKKHKIEESLKTLANESIGEIENKNDKENEEGQSVPQVLQSHLVTGDLVQACIIM